jgi:hypothetical protein
MFRGLKRIEKKNGFQNFMSNFSKRLEITMGSNGEGRLRKFAT